MNNSNETTTYLSDISFDIVGEPPMFPDYPCARILVDGKPFVEMVRTFEKHMLEGNKETNLAGTYWYLHPESLTDYLEGPGYGEFHRIAILGCSCLDEDCWPLVCSMEQQEDCILWYDFFQPHRKNWDYSDFGPFAFAKKQFYSELKKLKTAMARYH